MITVNGISICFQISRGVQLHDRDPTCRVEGVLGRVEDAEEIPQPD